MTPPPGLGPRKRADLTPSPPSAGAAAPAASTSSPPAEPLPTTEEQQERQQQHQQHDAQAVRRAAAGAGGTPHPLGRLASLPVDIVKHQLLDFLDGGALTRWAQASGAARALAAADDELWATVLRREYGWICGARSPSFMRPREYYWTLRWATCARVRDGDLFPESGLGGPVAQAGGRERPGKLHAIGGSEDRPNPLGSVEAFHDAGNGRAPGGWPCPFRKATLLSLGTERSAPGVVRDWDDGIWVVGGAEGAGALASVEVLGVEEAPLGQGGVLPQQPQQPWHKWRRKQAWEPRAPLATPRCFLASIIDERGRIYALGGGSHIWQGARVYKSTEMLDSPASASWRAGPAMTAARCGHAAAINERGQIYAAGGYAGGTQYLASVEMLATGGSTADEGRGWIRLAPMSVKRSGFGLAHGPDGCFYAAGGSPNGLHNHKRAERFDPREGRWQELPSMVMARGYCAATFGASGLFYVAGGHTLDDHLLPAVEVFDPRAGRWRVLPGSEDERHSVARVDLALLYAVL